MKLASSFRLSFSASLSLSFFLSLRLLRSLSSSVFSLTSRHHPSPHLILFLSLPLNSFVNPLSNPTYLVTRSSCLSSHFRHVPSKLYSTRLFLYYLSLSFLRLSISFKTLRARDNDLAGTRGKIQIVRNKISQPSMHASVGS